MPIIHFINSKSQSTGGMKNVLGYVSKEEKTQQEDKRFVTGVNCSPETCAEEFTATKNLYHKNSGRLYYHAVQSFPSGYEIDPALAHKIAVEFAEKAFGKYECVVATHIDRDHIHSHFVFNSVSFENGKKYHSDQKSVLALMKLSDEICAKYGVPILDDPADGVQKKKSDVLTDREYRSAKKGESFKFELMNAINQAMKQAKTKRQFCWLMRQYGYGVRWEDNRKYITYTCPNGRKCRCNKLHGERYGKEMMELEFEIRRTASAVKQSTDHSSGYASGNAGAGRELESTDRSQPQAETVRTCRGIQQETAQEMQTAAGHLRIETDNLCKQAGRLNEQFLSALKELDSYKHRLMRKTVRAVLISQVLLLILSAGLQLWLR